MIYRGALSALGSRLSATALPRAGSREPRADSIVRDLTRRGELWEVVPGVVGLRGEALALFRKVERALAGRASLDGATEWLAPPAIALETLARAD